jgi:hypothetical protein
MTSARYEQPHFVPLEQMIRPEQQDILLPLLAVYHHFRLGSTTTYSPPDQRDIELLDICTRAALLSGPDC